jgi:hypothetical protein
MTTDFRALCAELLMALENAISIIYCEDGTKHISTAKPIVNRARSALADELASVVSEPSDEEIMELWHGSDWYNEGATLREFLSIARAVLARWGNLLPVPPADGEVAELISKLQRLCADLDYDDRGDDAGCCYRAAELLQRQAPVPVSVSERLPGPEDCDAEGRCWVHQPHEACPESPAWELMLAKYASANYEAVCWLPANALPLPQGEVEP